MKPAFRRMIRDFAFSRSGRVELHRRRSFLNENEYDAEVIVLLFQEAIEATRGTVPPLLQKYLRDAHTNTWYQLAKDAFNEQVVRTLRGTRPESPMADIGIRDAAAWM